MSEMRRIRFLAPNLITTATLVFGMLSLAATARGEFDTAGWFIIYGVLGDQLDGLVARLVRGTSDLGVQLDSFADFLNFGVAPAYLFYTSLGTSPMLPFMDGWGRTLLMIACAIWILSAAFRLARYNITDDEAPPAGSAQVFFGVPTTRAGGLLVTWFLALHKYAPAGETFPLLPEPFGGIHLFSGFETPIGIWHYFPVAMLIGAYLMASTLRMRKLGPMRSKVATVMISGVVLLGGLCGLTRMFPDYMVWPPSIWLVVFLIWGQLSPVAKEMKPPPLFPRVDPPTPQQ